jgi:hypothetical protein
MLNIPKVLDRRLGVVLQYSAKPTTEAVRCAERSVEAFMALTDLLELLASGQGADALEGAIVLARLNRPIDELIANALGLGPYHPGKPSPWSHTFLIAEPFRGSGTKILDCTIRTDDGKIDWNGDLLEILGKGIDKNGRIYDGTVGDYDDPRITKWGVKWIPVLAAHQRSAIVSAAKHLQAKGYHYDVPGLVRELVRLLTGIAVPVGKKLLFCSAFVQTAYRAAGAGDFAVGTAGADVTPDDIWYSTVGQGFTPS